MDHNTHNHASKSSFQCRQSAPAGRIRRPRHGALQGRLRGRPREDGPAARRAGNARGEGGRSPRPPTGCADGKPDGRAPGLSWSPRPLMKPGPIPPLGRCKGTSARTSASPRNARSTSRRIAMTCPHGQHECQRCARRLDAAGPRGYPFERRRPARAAVGVTVIQRVPVERIPAGRSRCERRWR